MRAQDRILDQEVVATGHIPVLFPCRIPASCPLSPCLAFVVSPPLRICACSELCLHSHWRPCPAELDLFSGKGQHVQTCDVDASIVLSEQVHCTVKATCPRFACDCRFESIRFFSPQPMLFVACRCMGF